jgi:hypothetical protein
MPSIQSASTPVNTFPNLFVSPYGNDGVIPLYSSIPLKTQTSEGCVPCVVCGNSNIRAEVIANEASKAKSKIDESVNVQVF